MRLDPATSVAHLLTRRPLSWEVLRRHGVDDHIGTLAEACASAGVDTGDVVAEIDAAERRVDAGVPCGGVVALVAHLTDRYHRQLGHELQRISGLARTVAGGSGIGDGRLATLRTELALLAEEVIVHIEKEEWVVFPWLRSGRGSTASGPVQVMELEHDEAMRHLRELRRLCFDYCAPPEAGPSVAALWRDLERLEAHLVRHIHIENNVLFPLALAG